ncbi:MAG TPA: WYL domain-containing protein [Spirochaetota bacterium]|nr:WYL domain-containing protein [Spirochaetota bacterium]
MAAQKKIERIIDLMKWLAASGSSGLARSSVLAEYEISAKTLNRDLEEIGRLFPFFKVKFDADEERFYCQDNSFFKKEKPAAGSDSLKQELSEKVNIFKDNHNLRNDSFILHFSSGTNDPQARASSGLLLEAVLEQKAVVFSYKNKSNITIIPFFFCYYSENWYLISLDIASRLIKKYRIDFIHDITLPLIRPGEQLSTQQLKEKKQNVINKINASKNIFIDLNERKTITISFRFFIDYTILKKDIKAMQNVSFPDKNDNSVVDFKISFNGFKEAKIFMNNWLGSFHIKKPEHLRQRYLEELEEAMDIV